MQIEKLPPVKATLQPSNHPYLNGAWTPQHEEVTATDLHDDRVIIRIDTAVCSTSLRQTAQSNPRAQI